MSAWAKIYVYFSIKTYFFYFTFSLFKTSHIKLFILHYILLKYQFFLIFCNCFSFFIHNNYHPLSSFILEISKEKKTTKYKMNNVNLNLYSYCSKLINLHIHKFMYVIFKQNYVNSIPFFLLYTDLCKCSKAPNLSYNAFL